MSTNTSSLHHLHHQQQSDAQLVALLTTQLQGLDLSNQLSPDKRETMEKLSVQLSVAPQSDAQSSLEVRS